MILELLNYKKVQFLSYFDKNHCRIKLKKASTWSLKSPTVATPLCPWPRLLPSSTSRKRTLIGHALIINLWPLPSDPNQSISYCVCARARVHLHVFMFVCERERIIHTLSCNFWPLAWRARPSRACLLSLMSDASFEPSPTRDCRRLV